MSHNKFIYFGLVLSFLVGIPAAVYLSNQTQIVRQRASGPTPTPMACTPVVTDAMLIIDTSGSMVESPTPDNLNKAKDAAKLYVDIASQNTQNKVGLVSFSDTANLRSGLTTSYSNVKSAISNLSGNGGTCIKCGLDKANAEIQANGRSGIKKVSILLSDGKATEPGSDSEARTAAINAAKNIKNTTNMPVYTIGLGSQADANLMKEIATTTGGEYFFSPTANDLTNIYSRIAEITKYGSVQGLIFNDTDGNGTVGTAEAKLAGWNVQALNSSNTVVASTLSNDQGTYTLTGLCDGNFSVKLNLQSGWTQTQPANNTSHSVTITKGLVVDDKNFGVRTAPTSTPSPFPPSVQLTASPSAVPFNEVTTLTWTSTDAQNCTASGAWSGSKPTAGSQVSSALTTNSTFILTCTGPGGSTTKQATVIVANAPTVTSTPPTLTFTAGESNIPYGGATTLTWTSTNTTSCTASGAWTGNKATSGSQSSGALTTNSSFVLTCTGPGGSVTKTVAITVGTAPTSTPIPATGLSFSVFLHSIGNSGDNANPTAHSLSNKTPLNPIRDVKVEIFNATNQLVASREGTMTYASASGSFLGSVDLGTNFVSGPYTVAIKSTKYLRSAATGIQTITIGTNNNIPATTLVAGDILNDNKLNILDYNILISCYTGENRQASADCTQDKNKLSDLNDEGNVDRHDYNLFIRELSVQSGFSL